VACERYDLGNALIFLLNSVFCLVPWYKYESAVHASHQYHAALADAVLENGASGHGEAGQDNQRHPLESESCASHTLCRCGCCINQSQRCSLALCVDVVRTTWVDYNFWSSFGFFALSVVYTWAALLSVFDSTNAQIPWWLLAGALLCVVDSYFYFASWCVHDRKFSFRIQWHHGLAIFSCLVDLLHSDLDFCICGW
jgi:hypothetical protein